MPIFIEKCLNTYTIDIHYVGTRLRDLVAIYICINYLLMLGNKKSLHFYVYYLSFYDNKLKS